MELNENAQIDTEQVRDVGRSGGGSGLGGLPIPIPMGRGGGIGMLILLAVLVIGGFVGGNALLGDNEGGGDLAQECARENPDRLQNVKCRNALYINSIQNYWQSALPESLGTPQPNTAGQV